MVTVCTKDGGKKRQNGEDLQCEAVGSVDRQHSRLDNGNFIPRDVPSVQKLIAMNEQ